MGIIEKIFGTHSHNELKRIYPIVDRIEALAPAMEALSDEELKGKTKEFKDRLNEGETLDDILPEAYAVVREAAWRSIGMRHYRVQLIGGIILHQGRIAEMRTGEGKTLVSTLPAYLNALSGKGVHIVTVNDYLAKRDAEWMGKVHEFLGLTVGVILNGMDNKERRAAYDCDITYVTNNELGFDYLRDNMVIYKEQLVQRGLNFAIIDEVDSVLIDEARTPLIISGQSGKSTKLYEACDILARQLERGEASGEFSKMNAIMGEDIEETGDFIVNEKEKEYTGVIRLRKTDIYTGEVLEDAEFTVLQWNRGKQTYQNDLGGQSILKFDVETGWYSTEELVLTDANQGRFKVVETKNPENYTGKYEKEVIFQKKENTDTDTVDLKAENTPVTLPLGNITIIKKIKEEDITWAHGNPTFSFVAEGTDLSGNPHRYEDYVTFTRGSYETDKNGYATLSVTLRNIPLGQYTVWEKPVLRYYLKDVRANTENVRIIKGAAPAYGTDPRKIASGTAALTMQNKNASLTFVNEKSRYDRYSHNDSIKNTIPVSFS